MTVSLVGNLTAAPRLVSKRGQTPRTIFSIAIEDYRGEGKESVTHFVNCTAWGTLAENAASSLDKGTRVVALARINTYEKEVEEDGEEKTLTLTSYTVTAFGPDLRWAEAEVSKVKPKRRNDDEDDDDDDDEDF